MAGMGSCYEMQEYDVIVVGAGHAGCEAGLASARLGKRTLVLTISMEAVAMMPCNPSIGGTGKGQLVKEIDALGGEMGLNIDKAFIQSRMLNRSKGPAVHSPRAQADKQRYHVEMKHTLERQENLDLRQGEAVDLIIAGGAARGVILKSGAVYRGRAVILATGTYLNGLIHVSSSAYPSGPGGMSPSIELAERLGGYGFPLRRFKTGTPARVLASSLDYGKMKEQRGDSEITPFSYMNDRIDIEQVSCWLTYTNPAAHRIVAENIGKTAPYGGYTTGVGPRYCLSIEDKVSRFPERGRHQLFLEPEGVSTEEVYVQGMSTSLPENIQEIFYRSIAGLEGANISRYAYSIEYDCIDPLWLKPSMEYKRIEGLFCAGQINGSSGYEEAAAQGVIAGINASRKIDGLPCYVPGRQDAYIGVLIDDLTMKGADEPYRIMTSRAEFRLLLRQDNADLRLTGAGHGLGLATEARYGRYMNNRDAAQAELARLESTVVDAETATGFLRSIGSANPQNDIERGVSLAELLKRPEVTWEALSEIDEKRPDTPKRAGEQAEIQTKYAGYIEKQGRQVEKFRKLEGRRLPQGIDYESMSGLRNEAVQKLAERRPESIGQASRISGVSPADINVLLINLMKMGK